MKEISQCAQEMPVELRLRRRLHGVQTEGNIDRFRLGEKPPWRNDTAIAVRYADDGAPISITVERPAHSQFPVFVYRDPTGGVILADTLAFMHDVATREDVRVCRAAQLRHLVFGRPPTRGLLSGVEVVDHGQRLVLERIGDRWEVQSKRTYDRMFHDAGQDWLEGLEKFAARLRCSVESTLPEAVLFSGGIDSSLLAALSEGDPRMLTARIPGDQFAPEVERARSVARLFDGAHRVVTVDHEEYLDRLVDVTRRTGRPCPAMQHVVQTRAVAEAAGPVLYGELGDGAFGFPSVGPDLKQWVEQSELDAATAASRRFSLASMRREDDCFEEQFRQMYGSVDRVHRSRSRRVRRILEWSDRLVGPGKRWERFLICGHTTDVLTVGCIRFVRDFASATGVPLHTPLMSRDVLDTFHRLDPATRYRDGGRNKPVLKALLAREMPGYEVDCPKLASGLPRTLYFTEGPLAEAFEQYPPPAPMDRAVDRALEQPQWNNSWILWPALSYSVWYREWLDRQWAPERRDLVVHTPGRTVDWAPSILA